MYVSTHYRYGCVKFKKFHLSSFWTNLCLSLSNIQGKPTKTQKPKLRPDSICTNGFNPNLDSMCECECKCIDSSSCVQSTYPIIWFVINRFLIVRHFFTTFHFSALVCFFFSFNLNAPLFLSASA